MTYFSKHKILADNSLEKAGENTLNAMKDLAENIDYVKHEVACHRLDYQFNQVIEILEREHGKINKKYIARFLLKHGIFDKPYLFVVTLLCYIVTALINNTLAYILCYIAVNVISIMFFKAIILFIAIVGLGLFVNIGAVIFYYSAFGGLNITFFKDKYGDHS